MALTLYRSSKPCFVRSLRNLSALLGKACAHAAESKVEPSVLIAARLAPDMYTFGRQIDRATHTARACIARIANLPFAELPQPEMTFNGLDARIAVTIEFLESVSPEQIDGRQGQPLVVDIAGKDVEFTTEEYVFTFALPSFYFHVTAAYCILRANAVKIGKSDYMGSY